MPDYQTIYLWMINPRHIQDATDPETGEVNATKLAEAAAHFFDHPEWLDDETHDVWGAAFQVADENGGADEGEYIDDDDYARYGSEDEEEEF